MSNAAADIAYYIPNKYRKTVYTILSIIGLSLLATTAGFVAIAATLPKWLIFTQAVFGVVSTSAHLVARANVPSETPSDAS